MYKKEDLEKLNASNEINSIVTNCIGTGINLQSKCTDAEFRRAIQALWFDWTGECDDNDCADFYDLQALALRRVIEGGE